jgi:hypothetical protein
MTNDLKFLPVSEVENKMRTSPEITNWNWDGASS